MEDRVRLSKQQNTIIYDVICWTLIVFHVKRNPFANVSLTNNFSSSPSSSPSPCRSPSPCGYPVLTMTFIYCPLPLNEGKGIAYISHDCGCLSYFFLFEVISVKFEVISVWMWPYFCLPLVFSTLPTFVFVYHLRDGASPRAYYIIKYDNVYSHHSVMVVLWAAFSSATRC